MPVQAQHDYLAGNYPVVREDAAQMCALQMQAEAGPSMLESPESLETAIERFIHKQVLPSNLVDPQTPQPLLTEAAWHIFGVSGVDAFSVMVQVLMTRPRDEWRQDVSGRYKVLEHFSKEDARLQFLRILRSLPYGAPALPEPALNFLWMVPRPLPSPVASQHTWFHAGHVNPKSCSLWMPGCELMGVIIWAFRELDLLCGEAH